MKQIILYVFLSVLISFPCKNFAQISINGKYSDTICFRSSECCITNLALESDSSYRLTYIGINHGRQHKTSEKGRWTFNHSILKLNPKDLSKSELGAETSRAFKFYNGNIWYYADTTGELTDIAFKRNSCEINAIKIISMNSIETKNTLDTLGEAIVKLKHNPSNINNIKRQDIKMLKKMAKENAANLISIDLDRKWTKTDSFEKDDYYILFLNKKDTK
ncbi:MAG: hypothetical protein Q8M29_04495 [Bacteroidota bacterium]|nr:hypothetical protein [Bacteroidota bacterium]